MKTHIVEVTNSQQNYGKPIGRFLSTLIFAVALGIVILLGIERILGIDVGTVPRARAESVGAIGAVEASQWLTAGNDQVVLCEVMRITGYNAMGPGMNDYTYDGTPVMTGEPIVGASWNIPMGAVVQIAGLGQYRVADRGKLGNGDPYSWIDVRVFSAAEAYAMTGWRNVCIVAT